MWGCHSVANADSGKHLNRVTKVWLSALAVKIGSTYKQSKMVSI